MGKSEGTGGWLKNIQMTKRALVKKKGGGICRLVWGVWSRLRLGWALGTGHWALDTWTKLKTKNKNNPDGERDRQRVSEYGNAMAN
jgi:hypothetical protein